MAVCLSRSYLQARFCPDVLASTVLAPASRAFSTISFTAVARSKITWPEQIRCTTPWSIARIMLSCSTIGCTQSVADRQTDAGSLQVAEREGADHSPSEGRVGVPHMLKLQQARNPFAADNLLLLYALEAAHAKQCKSGAKTWVSTDSFTDTVLATRTQATCILSESQASLVLKHRRSNPFASIRDCGCWPPGIIRLQGPLCIASCHRQILR